MNAILRLLKFICALAVVYLGAAGTLLAQSMTNLSTMITSADTYAGYMSTVFWSIFAVAAGLTVAVFVWKKLRKGASA